MKRWRRVMSHNTEELCKVWKKRTLCSKNDIGNLVNLNVSNRKPVNLHFDVLLLSIAYKVSAKKDRRIISHDTKDRSTLWRKTDFLFEKWREEFGEL